MSSADCSMIEITASAFLRQLQVGDGTVPQGSLEASMDWTCSCNLRCQHCFVSYPGATRNEMTTDQVRHVLKNLADHGVLFLVITGGDPLIRRDFNELYLYAKSLGFMLTIFTNATLVTQSLADLLAANPPRRVEATIYGHTERTYEAVTGIPGSFRRFRAGVDALLRRGLRVRLKTMVMEKNKHEFDEMKAWVKELKCDFRYDAVINGRLNGDMTPAGCRILPEEVARLHFLNSSDKAEVLRRTSSPEAKLPPKKALFECGAGMMTLHVDAQGKAHPCMLWRHDPYDLLTKPLDDQWQRHVQAIRKRPPPAGECTSCKDRALCSYCPPLALIETGHPSKAADPRCVQAEDQCGAAASAGQAHSPPDRVGEDSPEAQGQRVGPAARKRDLDRPPVQGCAILLPDRRGAGETISNVTLCFFPWSIRPRGPVAELRRGTALCIRETLRGLRKQP